MTPELYWLLATMVLAASMWLPYIVGVNMHLPEGIDAFQKPYDETVLPDWVQRADRAHMNLLEQSMPFAVIVLMAHVLGVSTPVTAWAAGVFFWLRVAHAVGMTTGRTRYPSRPIIFTAAWACILVIAWQVVAHA